MTRTLREVTDLLEQQPEEPALWQERPQTRRPSARSRWRATEYALTLDATLIEAASASADLARFGGKPLETVLSRYTAPSSWIPCTRPCGWAGEMPSPTQGA